ncbi:hypothetical protein NicSoilE8_14920 [Arthrobacter sp. NicSoilE8]|nr:hypothetical protein NicSoilE8_14920 [Arthrobacter sp. NicSoilE8]
MVSVTAVTSVANVTNVVRDTNVISVNLSHLFPWHKKSAGFRKTKSEMPSRDPAACFSCGAFYCRLGERRVGVATLFRE